MLGWGDAVVGAFFDRSGGIFWFPLRMEEDLMRKPKNVGFKVEILIYRGTTKYAMCKVCRKRTDSIYRKHMSRTTPFKGTNEKEKQMIMAQLHKSMTSVVTQTIVRETTYKVRVTHSFTNE